MRPIYHLPVHAYRPGTGICVEQRNNAPRSIKLLRSRLESGIDRRDLRRMDGEHARKTIPPCFSGVLCQTLRITEIGENRIYCRYFRGGGGNAGAIEADSYYLVIDGIDGGATSAFALGAFEIDGFSFDIET